MSELLLGLSIAYVFLLVLLLLVLIYGQLPAFLKIGLIILSACFYVLSYESWKHSQGWPAKVDFPEKFLLHYVVIEEPDKELGSEGQIFLWLTDLYNERPAQFPRSYRLAYDRSLHGKLDEAMRQQRNGNIQLGVMRSKHKGVDKVEKNRLLGQQYDGLEFTKLPDPALPEK